MKQFHLRHLVLAAIMGSVMTLTVTSVAWSRYEAKSPEEYRKLLYEVPVFLDPELVEVTRGVMERSMVAHNNRDTDAAIAELAEGYSWMGVVDGGYQEMVSGRDTVEQVTRDLYEGSALDNYSGADSYPIAIVGNFGIQLDLDLYENEDGSQKITTSLNVFEVRDGKLLRLWAFFPSEPASGSGD